MKKTLKNFRKWLAIKIYPEAHILGPDGQVVFVSGAASVAVTAKGGGHGGGGAGGPGKIPDYTQTFGGSNLAGRMQSFSNSSTEGGASKNDPA